MYDLCSGVLILKPAKRVWLRELRESKGLTQKEIATLSGLERSTYAKAELGYSISVKTAKKIASVFGFDWSIFFENECDVL